MTQNLFLIFNHTFTLAQESDARASLEVERIIVMPEGIRNIWGNVPPERAEIYDVLEPVRLWLSENAQKGDYVLIQGDFGATFLMVNYAFENGLAPVYATTRRVAIEEHQPDGTVKMTHHFKHHGFRKYER